MEDSRPMADRIDLPLVNAGFRIFFSRDCVAWSIGLCLTQTFSFDREKHTAIAAHVKGGAVDAAAREARTEGGADLVSMFCGLTVTSSVELYGSRSIFTEKSDVLLHENHMGYQEMT